VTALYKGKGSRSNASSYRPISVTSCMIRFLERRVMERLWKVLEPRLDSGLVAANLPIHLQSRISTSQAGFRQGFCTMDHLLALTTTLHDVARKGHELPVAFLDITKAYDKTWRDGLLVKCHRMGIKGSAWRWLDAFLSHRRMRVCKAGLRSGWKTVEEGLPQGSVLAPLLFLIYVNDVVSQPAGGDCHEQLFADDMMLHPRNTTKAGWRQLQRSLDAYTQWADRWRVSFSRGKSNVVWFSNRRYAGDYPTYKLQGFDMPVVSEYSYLGVTYEQQLNWAPQHGKVLATLRRTGWRVCRLMDTKARPSIRTVRHLVRAIMVPQLAYTLPFVRYNQHQMGQLESELLRVTRKCLHLPQSTAKLAQLADLGIPTLADLRDGLLCCMATRTARPTNGHNWWNTEMLQQRLPTALAAVDAAMQTGGLNAVLRKRRQLSIIDEIAVAHRRLGYAMGEGRRKVAQLELEASLRRMHSYEGGGASVKTLKTKAGVSGWILSDGREAAIIRARVRFRRAALAANVHRWQPEVSDRCAACDVLMRQADELESEPRPVEDDTHVLLHCPAYSQQRQRLVTEAAAVGISWPLTRANILAGDSELAALTSDRQRTAWLKATERFLVAIARQRGHL
jgi:ribonuclease P/MRP protein subunit RPP40